MVPPRFVAAWVLLCLVCHHTHAEAGPGEEDDPRPVDDAYMSHVQSIFSAIMMSDKQAAVQGSDLDPQEVDVHTLLPRIPGLKVGMNAMGHRMLHVHSDEPGSGGRWSSEILSSGLTAGFALTDRVKGMQQGAGSPGNQWLMYSQDSQYRLKDEGSGDVLVLKDGSMTLQGNKGEQAKNPRVTVAGGEGSVPRVTLVSKTGGVPSIVSLYNKFGKFGVSAGPNDASIFHITADGAEMGLVSATPQPHLLVESTAATSTQEIRLRGKNKQINMYHKAGAFGICGSETAKGAKCKSFFQVTPAGKTFHMISSADSINLKLSHSIRGGTAALELVSPDKLGTLTSTGWMNKAGTLVAHTEIADKGKDVFEISKDGDALIHGNLLVKHKSVFQGDLTVNGDILVSGVVTMTGGSDTQPKKEAKLSDVFTDVQNLSKDSADLSASHEKLAQEFVSMRSEMQEMASERDTMRAQMQSMLQSMQMMQETMSSV